MENNLDNILKFDANGDIIYSKDLFMILVSGEFDDIIINHPELLDIIRKGVSELFDDWSILDTALTMSTITLLKCAVANNVPELFGADLTKVSYMDAETSSGTFADALAIMIPNIIELAKDGNKKLSEMEVK